jgi:hypothetical protein
MFNGVFGVRNGGAIMTEFLTRNSTMPSFLIFPRFLLESDLNETAKLLYVVLLDRARLSQQDARWADEQGRVFQYFPIAELAKTLHKSDMTIKTALAALERKGLIVRERRGTGQANRIFVKCHADSFLSTRQPKNFPPDRRKTFPMAERKLSTNNNNRTRTIKKYVDYYDEDDGRNYDWGEGWSL